MNAIDQPTTDERAAQQRLDFIRGLRELAGWLADHPDALVHPGDQKVTYYPSADGIDVDEVGEVEVRRMAAALGLPVVGTDTEVSCGVEFAGGVRWECKYLMHQRRAAWRALVSYSGAVQPEPVGAP